MERAVRPLLAVRDLAVVRGGRTIVDVAQLDVQRGEVLAIIGPNGAGKSTLLLQLALLERPTRGRVDFDGAPTRGKELRLRRRMAMVFQEPLLLDRSVVANVETGMALRGVPARQRRERAMLWLRRFGVEALAQRSSRTLSGGEAQRVSLARAFALEPEILFLDEPFSALDQPTRLALLDDVASALGDTGVTAVVVTHDHDEAARLGDRVAVMLGGRIRQAGAPADVFAAPVDESVATFVGVETMLRGRVTARSGGLVTIAVGHHLLEAVADGSFTEALVCLRPEDVMLSRGGEDVYGSARNKIPGRVSRIVTTGADARVELDCGFALIARVTRRSLEDMRLDVGDDAVASFKATAIHLIPKR
jgi:tungstate transport system ATP-binding protein